MGVTFVLGRSASNREEMMIGLIGQAAADPLTPVLVIVPPQATYATECMILEHLKLRGMMGIGVASIARVCDRVLHETFGAASPCIDAAGKSMLVQQMIDRSPHDFPMLGRLRTQAALPPQIAAMLDELKKMDISPGMLRTFADGAGGKLLDLALIYERLDAVTAHMKDTEDRMNIVIEHIRETEFIQKSHVFFHGFDMMNAQMTRFCTEIMNTAKSTALSFLYAGANAADSSLYTVCDENRMRLYQAAKSRGLTVLKAEADAERPGDILHIEKNLFAYPAARAKCGGALRISFAGSMEAEAAAVAAQIAWLHEKKGYRFSDMAVLYGSAQMYKKTVRRCFEKADIPCFTGEKRVLFQSNLAMCVTSAAELARGKMRKDLLLAHMESGYCNITEKQRRVILNYAFSNVRDGFAFEKAFADPTAEEARAALMEPISALRRRARHAATAAELAGCVGWYLQELRIEEKVARQLADMREAALFEDAAFLEQAYERIFRLMTQAQSILGDSKTGGKQLARILKAGMEQQEIGVIPPGTDEVACGEIAGMHLPEIRALFVLGCNEGILPSYVGSADLLTDEEWSAMLLGMKGIRHAQHMEKQRLAIVKAFSRPKEALYLSYVHDGQAQPSAIIDRMHRMFCGIQEEDGEARALMLKQNAYQALAKNLRAAADGTAKAAQNGIAAAVLKDTAFEKRLSLLKRGIDDTNRPAFLGQSCAGQLYGAQTAFLSATRLECFYGCPYRHFITYGLRAEKPREYTVDRIDAGQYAHSVLDRLAKEIKKQDTQWAKIPQQEFESLIRQCAESVRKETERYGGDGRNRAMIRAVTREIEQTACAIRRQCEKAVLQPYETEYRFSLAGHTVVGVIDRIDTGSAGGQNYFGIVDYKTGERDFDLARLIGGVDLQLIIYILAARTLLGDEYAFAGAHYMRVFGAMREREGALMPLYRMRGIAGAAADAAQELYGKDDKGYLYAVNLQVKGGGEYYARSAARCFSEQEMDVLLRYGTKLIENAVQRMEEGDNRIEPFGGKAGELPCIYCDYKSICRFDEHCSGNARRQIAVGDREQLMEAISRELVQ